MTQPPREPAEVASVLEDQDEGERPAERVEAELSAALADNLLEGRKTADMGQTLLAAITVFVFWGVVAAPVGLGWLAVFLATAVLRAVHRNREAPRLESAPLLAFVRRDVWLSAAMWGLWAFVMMGAETKDLAVLFIIFAGLVAAATSTLVADGSAFRGFMALVLGPLVLTVVLSGLTRDNAMLLLLLALYAPFMFTVYHRAHDLLTAQIRTSSRLRMTEEETARRRDFLNALVTSAPSPIVVADSEGRVLRVNPAFERVLGYRWEDVEDEGFASQVATEDVAADLRRFLAQVAQGVRGVGEFPLTHKDGHRVWMRISGTAARGTAAGTVILVGEDVTDQVAAREAQEEARSAAEQVARAKSAFLATMSHEIRTPLNGILGMIELLLDTELDPGQLERAQIIKSSGEGLLRILNDILDVSKIEAGQLDLEIIDFGVTDVTEEAVRMFAAPATAKHIEILMDVDPDVPGMAHGDPTRIRQVLANLLSNAVKFTHDGEITLGVAVAEKSEEGFTLRFAVRDTGIGIAREKQEQIFQEFEQADSSTTRTYGGSGLGLAICKRLVELMGGVMAVRSEPGEGSEFFFTVPLTPAHAPRAGVRRTNDVRLEDRHYLVVDDNENARRIARAVLEDMGGHVAEAASVDEGLAALRARFDEGAPFDVVISDHMMPDRDGLELAREVRDDPDLSGIPILMLTSAGSPGSWTEVRQAGIAGYLAKPVARDNLVRALRELLGRPDYQGSERRLVTEETLSRDQGTTRILLAEDNVVNQKVAVSLLEKRGYEVTAVENGQEAVDAAQEGDYQLILMDIQMPVMDGLEATRTIRARPEHASLPIIALTAHAFADERERCEAAGMNDFLAKPFKPADLYHLVERWTEPARPGEESMEPPVDIEGFREIMRDAGVEEIVDTTLDIYMEEAPTIFVKIEAAVSDGDAEAIRAAAHSLKSSSKNIRAHGLAELLQALENAGKAEEPETASELFGRVASEYRAVMAYLGTERGA